MLPGVAVVGVCFKLVICVTALVDTPAFNENIGGHCVAIGRSVKQGLGNSFVVGAIPHCRIYERIV